MKLKLKHLTIRQHLEAATIIRKIEDDLIALTHIVERAQFTTDAIEVMRRIKLKLRNPLATSLSERTDLPVAFIQTKPYDRYERYTLADRTKHTTPAGT